MASPIPCFPLPHSFPGRSSLKGSPVRPRAWWAMRVSCLTTSPFAAQSRQEIHHRRIAGKIPHAPRCNRQFSEGAPFKRFNRAPPAEGFWVLKGCVVWCGAGGSCRYHRAEWCREVDTALRFYPVLLHRLKGLGNCMGGVDQNFEWARTTGVTSDNKTG